MLRCALVGVSQGKEEKISVSKDITFLCAEVLKKNARLVLADLMVNLCSFQTHVNVELRTPGTTRKCQSNPNSQLLTQNSFFGVVFVLKTLAFGRRQSPDSPKRKHQDNRDNSHLRFFIASSFAICSHMSYLSYYQFYIETFKTFRFSVMFLPLPVFLPQLFPVTFCHAGLFLTKTQIHKLHSFPLKQHFHQLCCVYCVSRGRITDVRHLRPFCQIIC